MTERTPIKQEHAKIISDVVHATNDMTRIKDGEHYTGGFHGYYVLIEHLFWRISLDHGEGTAKRIFEEVVARSDDR